MKKGISDSQNTYFMYRFIMFLLAVLQVTFVTYGTAWSEDHFKGIKFQRPTIRFEVNNGQTDPVVRFTARDSDGISFLTPGEAVLQITRTVGETEARTGVKRALKSEAIIFENSFVRLKTVGANPTPRIIGVEQLPGVTNYFIGNDKRKWRTNVPGYAKVKYEGIYPGIDLVYHGNKDGRLEYDFIVAPGADPNRIVVSVEGAQGVESDPSGGLIISAATGKISQPAPRIYQEINGKRQEIGGGYKMVETDGSTDKKLVAFSIKDYDATRPLVIDPEIIYATYLGGSSKSTVAPEGTSGVAVDAQGSAYIVGTTVSVDFPTKNPLQSVLRGISNAYVTKLDANGQLVYSTYLGGSFYGSGAAVKVDGTGAVYVAGQTSSPDFPLVNAFQTTRGGGQDAFITKLSPDGSQVVYSTYLGGSDDESVADLLLDEQKNLYVVGNINMGPVPATNFPTVNPIQATPGGGFRDGFMSIISANGSKLLFSTYLGGDGDDFFQSIDRDANTGNVYLAFYTDSSNFPPSAVSTAGVATAAQAGTTTSGCYVVKLDVDSYGLPFVVAAAVAIPAGLSIDNECKVKSVKSLLNSAEVLGVNRVGPSPGSSTHSAVSAAQAGGGLDVELVALDQNLNVSQTVFFGGSGDDTLSVLARDTQGAVYVVGETQSTDLPTVNPIQATYAGGISESFLAVFDPPTLQPVFATYLGGKDLEYTTDVTVDPQGNIYVVGVTYGNFPTPTPGAIQNQLTGRTDGFIIKISPAIAGAQQPTLTLTLNQSVFNTGSPLAIDLTLANLGSAMLADVYFGVLLPASMGPAVGCPLGDAIIFFANGLTTPVVSCASAPIQNFPHTFAGLPIPAGLQPTTIQNFFDLVWPQGVPAGVYQFFMLLTQANAFLDGIVNPGDIVAVGSGTATFSP